MIVLRCFLFILLSACAHAASVKLAWDANTESDIAGYKVHTSILPLGASDGPVQTIDVGNVTQYEVGGLVFGTRYFFAATAYNTSGLESGYSNQVNWLAEPPPSPTPTPTPTPPPDPNLVLNPSFEADSGNPLAPANWDEWSNFSGGGSFGYADSSGAGTHSGLRHYTEYCPVIPLQFYLSQTMTVPNGTYTASAWVRRGGPVNLSLMEAKDFGGAKVAVHLPITTTLTKITIPSITVTNGKCTLGFYSDSKTGGWFTVDDVRFEVKP